MKPLALIFFTIIFISNLESQPVPEQAEVGRFYADTLHLNYQETELAAMINEYRASKNLPGIRLSASLSLVARVHVYDLSGNYRQGNKCNLHSWSADGYWNSCCYTPDHRKASCMWDKPRELSNYKGDGYEIAFYSNYNYDTQAGILSDALAGWKSSRGHNELIVNKGKWATANWKAMGVGVYGGFVVVWFGEEPDPAGEPLKPDE